MKSWSQVLPETTGIINPDKQIPRAESHSDI